MPRVKARVVHDVGGNGVAGAASFSIGTMIQLKKFQQMMNRAAGKLPVALPARSGFAATIFLFFV